MNNGNVKYLCKECGKEEHVDSYNEIIKNGKLCLECISKNNLATRCKKEISNIVTKKKKQKESKRFKTTWTCSECGYQHSKGYKPFRCRGVDCNSVSFHSLKAEV